MEFLTNYKIPLGDLSEAAVNWLIVHMGWLFDGFALGAEAVIDAILWCLQTPPALVVVAAFAALAWALRRNWQTPLGVVLALLFVINQGY